MIFKGNCTALVTPFSKDGKKIDFNAFEKLLDIQLASKSAILVLGTTGESSTLTQAEKEEIVKFTLKKVNKKVPVIVGSGSNNTEVAIKNSLIFEELGADALLHITPYYNKASQDGMIKHFKSIAKNTKLPILLYNVPSRTGLNILPTTVKKLCDIENIVGIKEASGNLNQISELVKICPNDFSVYSGDDNLTLPSLSVGAKGAISVAGNLFPQKIQDMCLAFFKKDTKKALQIHQELFTISQALLCDINPMPVKSALKILGLTNSTTRLPLCNISKKNYLMLKSLLIVK